MLSHLGLRCKVAGSRVAACVPRSLDPAEEGPGKHQQQARAGDEEWEVHAGPEDGPKVVAGWQV